MDTSIENLTTDKTESNTSKNNNQTGTNIFDQLFTRSNIVILLWFLGIYVVVSFIMRLTSTNYSVPGDRMVIMTRMLDFVVLIFLVIVLILSYFYKSEKEKEKIVEKVYDSLVDYVDKPISIVTVGVFIAVLYMFIMILGIPMDQNKPVTVHLLENLAWVLFAVLLIAAFFKYVLRISISEFLNKTFDSIWNRDNKTKAKTTDKKADTVKKEEVFNVSNNVYTYNDAQAVCKSLNSRLATYDEIEKAYNDGGEWCNYGWSANQSAYFPTQKKTWADLQTTEKHKHDCGRPGVNGGYMANPNIRFGVNCYGKKPKPTAKEIKYMESVKDKTLPKTPEDIISEFKVEFFKKNSDKFLQLNSFNKSKWSEV